MVESDSFLYSPLCTKTVSKEKNRALLLQFILNEIFHCIEVEKEEEVTDLIFSSHAWFFPYDWSREVGSINKIKEHAQLLPFAFPKLPEPTNAFDQELKKISIAASQAKKGRKELSQKKLKSHLGTLYEKLLPFLAVCASSENLLLFLLRHADHIDAIDKQVKLSSTLYAMFPNGTKAISKIIRQGYQKRGFHLSIPEVEKILEGSKQNALR